MRFAPLVLAACLAGLGGVSARAETPPPTGPSARAVSPPPPPADGPLRDFTLRNLSGDAITEAHATIGGRDQLITAKGPITNNHAQSFRVGRDECVQAVTATLQGGATLRADGLSDCRAPEIVVRADKIEAASSARPDAAEKPFLGQGTRAAPSANPHTR